MAVSSSPLISNTCTVERCKTEARYIASCNHILCPHHVAQIDSGESLLCPVNNELIQDNFRLLSNPAKSYHIDFIKRTIEGRKAGIQCCALGVCFVVVFGVGFTYFQLR